MSTPSFADLGVPREITDRLRRRGIESPYEIQAAALPHGLAGEDLLGRAPTGSGKTLAFGIPIAAGLRESVPGYPVALVLVPTRELAAQVAEEVASLLESGRRRVLAVYGGTGYGGQRTALRRGADVVVACPGRLEDLIAGGDVNLSHVETVVLDEADRMADMGFLPAVRRIVDLTPDTRHMMLFSATLDGDVNALVRRYLTDPVTVDLIGDEPADTSIEQHFWKVDHAARLDVTAEIAKGHERVVVFCRTKHGADRVARRLDRVGITAVAIHGNRSQGQREKALAAFSNGRVRALVATDVAARGIHVDDVGCVIHFDPAGDIKDHLHRSGRTGRGDASGVSITLVTDATVPQAEVFIKELGGGRIEPAPTNGAPSAPAVAPAATPPRIETPAPARRVPGRPGAVRTHMSDRVERPERRSKRSDYRKRVTMPTGTVKFFNQEKGYGFISRDGEPDKDIFVHFSNIVGDGYRTLEQGQAVEFEVAAGRKGDEAQNVRAI